MGTEAQSKKRIRLELDFSECGYAQLLELKDRTGAATPAEVVSKALMLYKSCVDDLPSVVTAHWRSRARVHGRT